MVRAMDSEHLPRPPAGASLTRLVEIMDRLLGPGGCPWDREQTLDTLRPFLVEETYEVLDALSRGDVAGHREELGDLLMQIVFHAALRAAEGAFDIDAVIADISDKLVRRHPHVFGDTAGVTTSDQVLAQWDAIKRAEKAAAGGRERILAGVKPGPALARAQKVGTKAAKVGFDWPDVDGPLAKVDEELAELREAIAGGDESRIADELGDLVIAAVNVARHVHVDAELAARGAAAKFRRRFEGVEALAAARRIDLRAADLATLDGLWDEVKATEP